MVKGGEEDSSQTARLRTNFNFELDWGRVVRVKKSQDGTREMTPPHQAQPRNRGFVFKENQKGWKLKVKLS